MFKISFNSSLANIFIYLIVALIVFLIYDTYRRMVQTKKRKIFFLLHIFSAIFILSLLLQPEISWKMESREKKSLYVLIDTSMSMDIEDKDGRTRLEEAKELISRSEYLKKFNPVFFAFGERMKNISPDEISPLQVSSNSTLIMKNIKELQRKMGDSYSAILLLTDGQETEFLKGEKLEEELKAPVYAIGLGEKNIKDVNIVNLISNAPLYLGENVKIGVYLKQKGYNGKKVKIQVKRGNKIIKQKYIKFSGNSLEVNFELPVSQKGDFIYEAEVLPLEGEKVIENNKSYILVKVISPKIRILYVDRALRWEHKFLKRYLESDIQLEPTFLVKVGENLYQQTGGKKLEINAGLFGNRKFLDDFDIIILGNVDFSSFTQTQFLNLRTFVLEKGKGLIFLGGENFLQGIRNSPLEKILPVEISGKETKVLDMNFTPSLTAIGENFPVFKGFSFFPELSRVNRIERAKKGAYVLLERPGKPSFVLVALNVFTLGKCLVILTDSTWKWYFGNKEEKKIYELFWGRIIRYLWDVEDYLGLGKTLPYISTSKKVYGKDKEVAVSFSFKRKTVQKIKPFVITPKGKKIALPVKNQKSSFIPREEGVYIIGVTNKGKTNMKEIIVKREGDEITHLARNEGYLKRISAVSGGKYIPVEEVINLKDFLRLPRETIVKNFAISEESRKSAIPLIFLFLSLCWWLRRRNNII